jgi:hypothetical protein
VAEAFCLRSFVVEGVLGGARPGMSRAEIDRVLGHPEQWAGDTRSSALIWRYGLFEVHFDEDVAWLLYTDYLDPPDAGSGRLLEPWILASGPLSQAETLSELRERDIEFELLDTGSGALARIANGADLSFARVERDGSQYSQWHGISVCHPSYQPSWPPHSA